MSYQIIIPKTVQKQLQKISNPDHQKIVNNLHEIEKNPRFGNVIKMQNNEGYRLRVGDYRILYDIDDDKKTVTLRRIAHRREVYRFFLL
jgi:mRNA interferase RelE/StbE